MVADPSQDPTQLTGVADCDKTIAAGCVTGTVKFWVQTPEPMVTV